MKILLTGSTSMVGRSILRNNIDNYKIVGDDHKFDLTDYDNVDKLFKDIKPTHVIHLASLNGNISFNNKYPSDIFYTTTSIAMNILKASTKYNIKKIVSAISSCAYPCNKELLIEEEFWDGEPHTSVDAHGFAKRFILEYSRQIYKQYQTLSVGVCFNTCYGPYDNFDLNKTKVMGSLIKKFLEAKYNNDPYVEVWGTGNPMREFIYVDDVAKMIFKVLDKYSNPFYPINVGSGKDISIRDLSYLIKSVIGYNGNILFNSSKPDGQMKKLLSNANMEKYFGPQEFTTLEEGIERTVKWYEANYNCT